MNDGNKYVLSVREAADLVADLASQEWQEPDGKRRCAVDNFGKRMWFVGDNEMQELFTALRHRKRVRSNPKPLVTP